MKRQNLRKLLLILAMLLFPVTIYYFSPAIIIGAGLEGVINGSFIVFLAMLIGSIFLGRLFCGFFCPAGGLQECSFAVNGKTPRLGWRRYIKYAIWLVWILIVVLCYAGKGITAIDFLYQTDHGISIVDAFGYIIYYAIVLLIIVPSILFGKRAFCHYLCWMAPFMVIGGRLRRLLRLPGLHIAAAPARCVSCGKCSQACPMSIDPESMVPDGVFCHDDCILCGACVDTCPKKALMYRMTRKKQ